MAPPLQFPETVQVVWNWTVQGHAMHNVTHARAAAGFAVTESTASTIFSAIRAAMVSAAMPSMLSTNASFDGCSVRDLRGPNLALIDGTGTPLVGTGAGDGMPPQIASVLTLRTALAGRGFRGRIYIPGWSELSSGPDGRMTATAKGVLDAFAAALVGAYGNGDLALAVFRRPVYSLPPTVTLIRAGELHNVEQVVCRDTRWDTQRRRAP